jgi:pyruvate, water dikinase
MWWQRLIRKKRPGRKDSTEINIWRLQSLFNNFRRILYLNNAVLEDMVHMERALGGEYIFDRTFLETSVRTIASRVHHVTYNLNALTGNGYIPLYDRYQDIRTILDDILSGNVRALACPPVLPLHAIGWELEPLVGIDLVCLAELRHHPGILVAEGFVITAEGTQILLSQKEQGAESTAISVSDVRTAIDEQLKVLLSNKTTRQFSIAVTRIESKEELVQELGVFSLMPAADDSGVKIVLERSFLASSRTSAPVPFSENISPLLSPPDSPLDNYVRGLERVIHIVFSWLSPTEIEPADKIVVFVRHAPPAIMSGTIHTRMQATDAFESISISATLKNANETGDTFLLRRTYPFDIIQSTITPRSAGYCFPDNKLATNEGAGYSSFGRGSTLVEIKVLKILAETAITLERMLGSAVAVHWECLEAGTYCITGLSPMPVTLKEISRHDLTREQSEATILCQGGQMVQAGVAAGSVVHVTDEMAPAEFPAGAVAVARVASPQLTPVLQRATAIITENGTTTGHLATVARELRLPAIFGVPGALTNLPPGSEVTVDAGSNTVYQGILEMLLQHGSIEMDLSPSDPEYRTLRRLLRFIMPLNLVNPESPNFSPQGCRTFHDIIHFCHEKAVDELAHFQEHRPGLGAIRTRRMNLGIPMDIRVLDIGGGMATPASDEPTAGDARSEPFTVFLGGLLDPQAQAASLPSLGLRDILSSMPRNMGMLSESVDTLGENLAIVSHDYMNISLRLGYHFSVIDAHLGNDGSRNYVYFRFAGGLADPERRGRRATFISNVLKAMDFKVTVKGDLVIGRLKLAETTVLRSALSILGALTSFSRQQDTGLYSDADTKALFTTFANTFLGEFIRTPLPATSQQDPDPPLPTDPNRDGTLIRLNEHA